LLSLWLADEKAKSEHAVPGKDFSFHSSSQQYHDFHVKFYFHLIVTALNFTPIVSQLPVSFGPFFMSLAQYKLHQLVSLADFIVLLLVAPSWCKIFTAKSKQMRS